MAENPFDDEDGTFYALVNEEGQYSLWPTFVPVPDGWSVSTGPATRQECLDHVEAGWTDLRPRSLIMATDAGESESAGQS